MEQKHHETGDQEFTYYIYARLNYCGEVRANLYDCEMEENSGRVLIGKYTVTHAIPEYETLVPKFITGLEAKKKDMIAVASAAVAEVDSQIQSLLALEHTV